MRGLPF